MKSILNHSLLSNNCILVYINMYIFKNYRVWATCCSLAKSLLIPTLTPDFPRSPNPPISLSLSLSPSFASWTTQSLRCGWRKWRTKPWPRVSDQNSLDQIPQIRGSHMTAIITHPPAGRGVTLTSLSTWPSSLVLSDHDPDRRTAQVIDRPVLPWPRPRSGSNRWS